MAKKLLLGYHRMLSISVPIWSTLSDSEHLYCWIKWYTLFYFISFFGLLGWEDKKKQYEKKAEKAI